MNSNLKELQTWTRLMEKMDIILRVNLAMQAATLKEFKNKIDPNNLQTELEGPTLFVHANDLKDTQIELDLFDLATTHQEAFYGRACGFQYCESLQLPLTGCAIALTSYNDGYNAFSINKENLVEHVATTQTSVSINAETTSQNTSNNSNNLSSFLTNTIGQAAFSMFSSTKYIIDPELRSKKMSHIVKNANVEFCKAFWQLTETSIVQVNWIKFFESVF
jgi:hormone-sensitive lipase